MGRGWSRNEVISQTFNYAAIFKEKVIRTSYFLDKDSTIRTLYQYMLFIKKKTIKTNLE